MAAADVRRPFVGARAGGAVVSIDAPSLLADLISARGWGAKATDAQLAELGALLATTVMRDRPWGRSYLSNVLARRVDAGPLLVRAIQILGAVTDGAPVELARAQRVQVLALGNVQPGALVLADSIPCAFVGCRVHFVPRNSRQAYHSPRCRLAAWRLAQKIKKEGS